MKSNLIFTIGHSTHSIEQFLGLLKSNQITAIADVRSSPYSRFNPQFNRENLKPKLKDHAISYAYLGRELGARSEEPDCYENGQVQYQRLAKTKMFKSGLQRVLRGMEKHRVTLMCAEKEPLECHRTILVGYELAKIGVNIIHILADGSQESHQDTQKRLFELVGLPAEDLFRSPEELLVEALRLQEKRIAYIERDIVERNKKVTA